MYPARGGSSTATIADYRPDRRRVWPLVLAPLVMIVAIPAVDAFLPTAIRFAVLLPVAPAFTAAIAGPRVTAGICALAIAAQAVAGEERHDLNTEQVILEACSLLLLSVLLVLFCVRRDANAAHFNRVQMIADTTQRAVLRPLPELAGPLGIATEYRPAGMESGGNRIGGDLFALTRTAHSTRLLMGDVRGHGLDAINDMAIVVGAFRAAAHRQPDLPELLSYLEGSMHWGLAELSGAEEDAGERFVTAVVADIPDDEPVVHLISCGHPPPLMVHGTTATPLAVSRPAPPLGLGALSDPTYTPETFAFPEGGHLLLYTDGASEARNEEGTFYPLQDRAARIAVRFGVAPTAFLTHLTDDLFAYAGGALDDDMAMIAVRRGSAAVG